MEDRKHWLIEVDRRPRTFSVTIGRDRRLTDPPGAWIGRVWAP
jgi:hypothetical protein